MCLVPVAMMSLPIRFDNNDHASSKMQFLHTMLLGPVHKYKYISGWGLTFCVFHILHASWITDWTSSGANSSGLCKWILQKPFGNERYCLLQVPWGGKWMKHWNKCSYSYYLWKYAKYLCAIYFFGKITFLCHFFSP